MSARAERLILVSAGLSETGGGAAALGRLVAATALRYCRNRGIGFEVLHLGAPSPALAPLPARHFHGRQAALAAALARAQRSRSSVVLFDHPGPARVQAFLPRFLRSRYAVFLLGIEVDRPLSWDRRRALSAAALRLAISEHTRRRCLAATPGLPAIDVLYPALEERAPEGVPDASLLERAGTGFFLVVGRLAASERYKGHDSLLRALATLSATHPGPRLLIVGDGDDRPRLEALTRGLGLEHAVLFTGFVSEATRSALYERSLAFAMPSTGEGFGLVYLEAMRAGRACVALAGSAAAEIVIAGETGLLVERGDAALADALRRLAQEPGLAARLGAAGCVRWRERFSAALFAEGLDLRLDRLLEAA